MRTTLRLSLAALLMLSVACSHSRSLRRRSDLMSFLYPDATEAPQPAAGPVSLQLPLRVGISLVPAEPSRYRGESGIIPAASEKRLLDILRKAFQGRDWVERIEIIPSSYLMPAGGFTNLDQIARMFNVDVIALASVDQIQNSDPDRISFLYLSIIGAYVLPLDRNETRTLIDAAVFHVPSRTFLLRAPGVSQLRGRSAAVDVSKELREKSKQGLELAIADLAKNLDLEVEDFKEKVVSGERADVDIVTEKGESIRSSGGFGLFEAIGLALLSGVILLRRRS